MAEDKMQCPDCGTQMNHHANKLDYTAAPFDEEAASAGVVVEAHTCRDCGRTETRPSSAGVVFE
ncbi:MAG TPA: hypothetical protein VGV38_00505 [Pyrinomonadaceae bacterium]|nr:hypothetical protein [Pyrinomonadaceae bacterium]